MGVQREDLIARGGHAYIRNLAAAEAAVRRGQFDLAKVLRATAHVQRALALRLARLDEQVFARRVATILGSDDVPDIAAPGPPWMLPEGHGYEQMPVEELLVRWAYVRADSLAAVRDLTTEDWARRGALRDATTTLLDLGVWLANHDLGHGAQIRRLCGK